jgi:hypothetical protein
LLSTVNLFKGAWQYLKIERPLLGTFNPQSGHN